MILVLFTMLIFFLFLCLLDIFVGDLVLRHK
jgi:hypothetical protein